MLAKGVSEAIDVPVFNRQPGGRWMSAMLDQEILAVIERLVEVQAQAELLKFENGQAAYATLRELAREIEGLVQREPSKRALLQALGELGAVIAVELERAPAPEINRPFKTGDRVHVRSLGKVGVLNQVDTRTNKAIVDFGSLPMTVALEDVESA